MYSGQPGPTWTFGDLTQLSAGEFGPAPVPDPNPDTGPNVSFMGSGLPDVRVPILQDHLSGFTGVYPVLKAVDRLILVDQIPAAHGAATIAAAANVVSGTPMTLVTAQSAGVTPGVPFHVWSPELNAGAIDTGLALDWGFAFGTTTVGSTTVTVANSAYFKPGWPLVIPGALGTGIPLLTNVNAILSSTTISVFKAATAAVTAAAVGYGDVWGPQPVGFPAPAAGYVGQARGPANFFDPTQGIQRGVVITCNNASGAGGTFTVKGATIWGELITETITSAPGTALAAYGVKTYKYIISITPNFTDATYTYSVGTSDVFGCPVLFNEVPQNTLWWAGTMNTASTGFTPGSATPATADARGTVQVSAIGGGSGIGSTASNGTISSLARSGNKLYWELAPQVYQTINGTQGNPFWFWGQTPA